MILGLIRYPVFLTTEHTEHTEINPPTVMSCFRVFGVFRGSLLVTGDDFAKAAGVAKVMVST